MKIVRNAADLSERCFEKTKIVEQIMLIILSPSRFKPALLAYVAV